MGLRRAWRVAVWALAIVPAPAWSQEAGSRTGPLPGRGPSAAERARALAEGSKPILDPDSQPIDLATALRLADVQNPDLLVARQRVVEAVAQRQFAAVQFLPTLNPGTDYDTHTGVLQQSNGNILTVNRSSLYVGAGANAVAAGTVSIPGVLLGGNVAQGVFALLGARQEVRQRQFASEAERNPVLLRTALAYSELTRAEARRAVAVEVRDAAAEVARITAEYLRTGAGREADADRAATYLARRQASICAAEGEILTASAALAELLNIDPSIRLHPTDAWVVPLPIVPDPIPLPELIALALVRRPEMGERRASAVQAMLALEGARVLPFSPTVLLGFSSGGFGGGSNLVRPVFGGFAGRTDFDVIAYWSIQNMGAGNAALIKIARAELQVKRFQELAILDQIRDEVAEARARTHARFAQIEDEERAVRSGIRGFRLDLERIRQGVPGQGDTPRPIEVIDSLRLLFEAQGDYVDAIVDYNRAHFELYVALGQPPAAALAHEVPTPTNRGIAVPPPAAPVPNPPPARRVVAPPGP
jgi:outer membrane protein TolC